MEPLSTIFALNTCQSGYVYLKFTKKIYLYCDELEGAPRLPRRDCEGWGGKERPSRGVLPGPNIPDNPLLEEEMTVMLSINSEKQ